MSKKKKKEIPALPIMASPFDPLGSWTGVYMPGMYELPDQDVDDL